MAIFLFFEKMNVKGGWLMKFTDGNWLIREGFELIPAVHYFKSYKEKDKLKVLVAPKDISNRAFQLDTPILTVEFSSVLEDTINVKINK